MYCMDCKDSNQITALLKALGVCKVKGSGNKSSHIVVQKLLNEKEGTKGRRAHWLKRRKYHNTGSNYVRHMR